jgi:hypothetical protein
MRRDQFAIAIEHLVFVNDALNIRIQNLRLWETA